MDRLHAPRATPGIGVRSLVRTPGGGPIPRSPLPLGGSPRLGRRHPAISVCVPPGWGGGRYLTIADRLPLGDGRSRGSRFSAQSGRPGTPVAPSMFPWSTWTRTAAVRSTSSASIAGVFETDTPAPCSRGDAPGGSTAGPDRVDGVLPLERRRFDLPLGHGREIGAALCRSLYALSRPHSPVG